jgi:F0F1-type ATP synthase membrane subunit c/vacuolar-type H+-ATPase subunit K
MLNFFIGFAFFEAGAFFGFFVAALLNAAHAGDLYQIRGGR